jgi:pyruvate/2-oxoglutarate dehydrogenase complex dihydrolipoamide acyltransferase (E2) component
MVHEITIPRLGWSMEEGVFSGWLKQDGDTIRQGDPLFELEGEKAVQEIEAVDAGILRIPANSPQPGSVVKVGAVVGYLVAEGESLPVGETQDASAIDRGSKLLPKGTPSLPSETVAGDAALLPTAGPAGRGKPAWLSIRSQEPGAAGGSLPKTSKVRFHNRYRVRCQRSLALVRDESLPNGRSTGRSSRAPVWEGEFENRMSLLRAVRPAQEDAFR